METAAQGELAQDNNSYAVLLNGQCSTRPFVPCKSTAGRFTLDSSKNLEAKCVLVRLLRNESIQVLNSARSLLTISTNLPIK